MLFPIRLIMRNLEWVVRSWFATFYWLTVTVLGILTIGSGTLGWLFNIQLDDRVWEAREAADVDWWVVLDSIQRGGKALFSSDIYLTDIATAPPLITLARFGGAVFFMLLAGRLFIFALGGRIARAFLWARAHHDVVIGDGEVAEHYAETISGRTTHIHACADERFERAAELERTDDLKNDLWRSGAGRARRIVVAEGEDMATWATARLVSEALSKKPRDIIANIEDPWLLERISRADAEAQIRPFSYASGAARQVLLAHPPYLLARAVGASAQHIIILGFGAVGQALLREFLVTSVSWNPSKMMVTVIDPLATQKAAEFQARHPGVAAYADISFLAGSLNTLNPELERVMVERCAKAAPAAVYVAVSDHPLRVAVGVKDRSERLGWFRAPIFVRATDGAGLKRRKQGIGIVGQTDLNALLAGDDRLHDLCLAPFGLWRDALDGCGLMSPEFDDQARTFHDSFRNLVGAPGKKPADLRPQERQWELLSEEFRVSNRRAAAHIRAKLDAAGYDLNKWLETGQKGGAPHASFDLPNAGSAVDLDDSMEMDRLGELEHLRWSIDRTLNGWRYGEKRDDLARIHPMLVPNRNLSEAEKEKDRANIRQSMKLIISLTD